MRSVVRLLLLACSTAMRSGRGLVANAVGQDQLPWGYQLWPSEAATALLMALLRAGSPGKPS